MTTTVVNLRDADFQVYIGRANWTRRLPRSKWMNPFRIGRHGTRDEVIEQYRQYVLASPDLMAALPELRGKVLGCWCKPQKCHGDALVELADALPDEAQP